MNHHIERENPSEGGIPSGDIESDARRKLEAAEENTDGERLEVLEQLYKDLEGALES
ncbi:MAG TPA: hypothetical protein VFA00_12625 [Actinomycetota bacterium]|nr:hypothetical protein [Actinomycetota bacterium]